MSPKKSKEKSMDIASKRTATTTTKKQTPAPGPQLLDTHAQRSLNATHGRAALAAYTDSPTSFSSSRVISHDENFVVIHDLYPKASIHILLLPRDRTKQLLHPFDAFDGRDAAFLSLVQAKVSELRTLAASELRRRFGRYSVLDRARDEALDDDPALLDSDPDGKLPKGRDWSADIVSGVHAHPSMDHLHVHILSVDRVSECMRHRKHYNSFATPFLVPVEEMPLEAGDERRHPGREGYLDRELRCWRCGKGFGNKFARLKEHLAEEFEEWKRL